MKASKPLRSRDKEPVYSVDTDTTLLPFLLQSIPGKSRNNIKSLLSRHLVAVDGRPTSRFDAPLRAGQQVSILSTPAPKRGTLPFPILYEDKHLIVINKPAKLLSVGNEKEKVRTAYHMVTDYVKCQHVDNRIFVLHRLDRDTSGVLMFARDEATKRLLQDNWSQMVSHRGYLALVEGRPKVERDTIRSFLVETKTHLIFSGDPGPGAKEAITSYALRRTGGGYSLLDVSIETGRKNQIRVHLSEMGCPVAGDKQYGAKSNPLGRLCLHAGELAFRHPATGESMRFVAKAPKEFYRIFR